MSTIQEMSAASRTRRSPPKKAETKTGDPIGDHLCQRVRQLRKERGWSLESLAQSSGVSRSMLSQIERGQANPTLAVAFRIARAFGLALADLVEAPSSISSIQVIRADDKAHTFRSDSQCGIRTLSPLNLEKDVEFYELRLRAGGGELRSAAHYEGTREFLAVEKGKVRVESSKDSTELGEGDSATYRADVPHAIVNAGRAEAVVFLVVIYR
jgi:transcriptional regulator with XRE-family HTH domain